MQCNGFRVFAIIPTRLSLGFFTSYALLHSAFRGQSNLFVFAVHKTRRFFVSKSVPCWSLVSGMTILTMMERSFPVTPSSAVCRNNSLGNRNRTNIKHWFKFTYAAGHACRNDQCANFHRKSPKRAVFQIILQFYRIVSKYNSKYLLP